MTQLKDLTAEQLHQAFAAAGMKSAAERHGNVFHVVRRGGIAEAVGTLKAGCSAETHKKARKALRHALRAFGVEI